MVPEDLSEGEAARFGSAAERDVFYRRPLYGEHFSTAAYLRPEREFHGAMIAKAAVGPGDQLLLIGEALDAMGLVALGEQAVGPEGHFEPVEMRPLALAHGGGRWGVYRELTGPYRDAEFHGVIAAQTHHCDELGPEIAALVRVVRPGGRVVLVDNGPTRATFDLARHDVLLDWLLQQFVVWAGSRHVPPGEAYSYQKAAWLAVPVEEIAAAARVQLEGVRVWEHRGMAIVDGTRPR